MAIAATASTDQDARSELVYKASQRKRPMMPHTGDVTAPEAFEYLAKHGGLLVDVRTLPEWQFVGVPSLSGCKGKFAAISWKIYPEMKENAEFAQELAQTGVAKDTPLFFICRGGGRSASAAAAMSAAGYTACFNVLGGFEGEEDANGHRGRVSGWQGSDLPWTH